MLPQAQPKRNAPRRFRLNAEGFRFRIVPFRNASGSPAWRVTGWARDGRRIRENYPTHEGAVIRRIELETEFRGGPSGEAPRETTLDANRLRCAEFAFVQLGDDADPGEIVRAAKYWVDHGRTLAGPDNAPRLADAAEAFRHWLVEKSGLRSKTQAGLRHELGWFSRLVGNPKLGEITPEFLDAFFAHREVSPIAKDAGRRALSRFFAWCIERPRRWMVANPAASVRVLPKNDTPTPPRILTVDECERLLRAAEAEGRLVPWFALGLFGGLRRAEVDRLAWPQINLENGEIHLTGASGKTREARVLKINPTLRAWLTAHRNSPLRFSRRAFRRIVEAAQVDWTKEALRHTFVTAFLCVAPSDAEVAQQLGNLEAVRKHRYLGQMSSADATQFFALRPRKAAP